MRTAGWLEYEHENDFGRWRLAIAYHVTPGERGCRYDRNGTGWPPSGPECELECTACMEASVPLDEHRELTWKPDGESSQQIAQWFAGLLESSESLRERVEEACIAHASEPQEV